MEVVEVERSVAVAGWEGGGEELGEWQQCTGGFSRFNCTFLTGECMGALKTLNLTYPCLRLQVLHMVREHSF